MTKLLVTIGLILSLLVGEHLPAPALLLIQSLLLIAGVFAPYGPGFPRRVVTYVRISIDERNQPTSLGNQRERLAAYIASQGWVHVREFQDEMTGKRLDRPGLQEMLAFVREGGADTVLVFKVDRFARRLKVMLQAIDELDAAACSFVSATESFDTGTPVGRMVLQILGVFAEFEATVIRERVIDGMVDRASKGYWMKGGTPYGLVRGAQGFLEWVAHERAIVVRIFREYVHDRLTSGEIAARLNRDGILKRGRPWLDKSVSFVLRNRVYIGEIFYRAKHYSAHHEPCIDVETFEAAQVLLDQRSRRLGIPSRPKEYLLTGLLQCGQCGHGMRGNVTRDGPRQYRYYECSHRLNGHRCPGTRLAAEVIEDAIVDLLIKTSLDDQLIARAIEQAKALLEQQRPNYVDELEAAHTELHKVEAAIENLIRAIERGAAADVVNPALEQRRQRRLQLLQTVDRLQTLLDSEEEAVPSLEEAKQAASALRTGLRSGSQRLRRAWLQASIVRIDVHSQADIRPVMRLFPGGLLPR